MKPKECTTVVRLHVSCVAVRPFARWFRRGWENAYNRGAVTRFVCGGLPSSHFGSARMTCGTQPRVVGWEPWSASVETLPMSPRGASEEIRL
jgi:hypothetical protein